MSFVPHAGLPPLSTSEFLGSHPIFNLTLFQLNKILDSRKVFEFFFENGVDFSQDEILSLDCQKLDIFQDSSQSIISLKKNGYDVTKEWLINIPWLFLLKIIQSPEVLSAFTKVDLDFPYKTLKDLDPDCDYASAIIENYSKIVELKEAGLNFTWNDLITISPTKLSLILEFVDTFIKLKKAGLEFTWNQLTALDRATQMKIWFVEEELSLLQKAGVKFSWEDITALDEEKKDFIKYSCRQLVDRLNQSNEDHGITWEHIIGSTAEREKFKAGTLIKV